MSDVQGIILHNILKDPNSAIEIWPKLKVYFFNSDYSHIYLAISKYFNKYNKLPSFEELKIVTRDYTLLQKVRSLELLSIEEDIDILVVAEALTDQFTQEEILDQLLKFLDKLPFYDSSEAKEKLTEILQDLEEKTDDNETIILMNDVFIIDEQELLNKVPLGLNNMLDAATGGMALTELVMIGGHRGSGKTIAACNVTVNQYKQGNIGLIFSIEMRAREIFNRSISILADVDNTRLRRMCCTPEELDRIAKVRSDMFVDSEEIYQDYLQHKEYEKFEIDLVKSKKLKPDNQIIIVDNQFLTEADIDLTIQKFKLKFGDKLKTVVIDYINQMNVPDLYNWQTQVKLSKGFKNLARKHGVLIVTPYQTKLDGEASLAKGLLYAADVSAVLTAHDNYINFKSTKTRNIKPFEFNAPINWDTMRISPQDAVIDQPSTEDKETASDIPWT